MTDTEKLEQLRSAVARMRTHQRAFFAAEPGTEPRRSALYSSKAAERDVDALLEALDPEARRKPVQQARQGLPGVSR
jgi:hypothetical protein